MSLVDEVSLLMDSTVLSDEAVGDIIAGLPTGRDEFTDQIAQLAALCKGFRLAIRRLAREIEEVRGDDLEDA